MHQNAGRHEYKHAINAADAQALCARLARVMQRDEHVRADGTYKIRSLYFDNLFDRALREKLDGVAYREKFRIRYYNDDVDTLFLEKKSKRCDCCFKQSASITRAQCAALLVGDAAPLAHSDEALLRELYAKVRTQLLRPRLIVDYVRAPFVYPAGNVRVTVDTQVRSGLYNCNLFDTALPTLPAGAPGEALLEVKFDAYLPAVIADIIQLPDRRQEAFSKYAACRIYG
nr:polyphosphate polymerase domain-containing protein [Maliibacterium massiliense]